MGENTLEVGQQAAGFQDRQKAALDQKSGIIDKAKRNKGFMSSIAALATSLGILGGTIAGHDTTTPIVDTATGAKDIAVDVGQGMKDRIDAMNNTGRYGNPVKPTEAPNPTPATISSKTS